MSNRRKHVDHARALAELPVPVLAVRPKGVVRKFEHLTNVNVKELRAQCEALKAEPPRTPVEPPPSPFGPFGLATPPRMRKKDPYGAMFIPRKPSGSPLRNPTERMRFVSSPYPPSSPSRPRVDKRAVSGPASDLAYYRVAQNDIFPGKANGHARPEYPAEHNVILGRFPDVGCCVSAPDAVATGPLNLSSTRIRIAFQWTGYECLGVFWANVHVRNDLAPFDARLTILASIKNLFEEFKKQVSDARRTNDMGIPRIDVLAFGNSDIRVTKLERCYEDTYQVVFIRPASKLT